MRAFVVLLLAALLAGCASRPDVADVDEDTPPSGWTPPSPWEAPPTPSPAVEPTPPAEPAACARPTFTAAYTDLARIRSIHQLGPFGGGSPGRAYTAVAREANGSWAWVPLYAPADGLVASLSVYDPVHVSTGAPGPRMEYGLTLDVGCGVVVTFAHVGSLAPALAARAPPPQQSSAGVPLSPPLPVRAGDLLGHANGTILAGTFDFMVTDRAHVEPHANLSRWTWEQSVTAVCPFDLYAEPLRAQHMAKVGTYDAPVPGAACGSPSHDVPGTLAGEWFDDPASTDMRGMRLALVTDAAGTVHVVLREGGNMPSFALRDQAPATRPEDAGPGQLVCYQSGPSAFFAKLLDDGRAESWSAQAGCADAPSGAGRVWER